PKTRVPESQNRFRRKYRLPSRQECYSPRKHIRAVPGSKRQLETPPGQLRQGTASAASEVEEKRLSRTRNRREMPNQKAIVPERDTWIWRGMRAQTRSLR